MFRGLWDRLFGPRPKSLSEQIDERTSQLQLRLLETQLASLPEAQLNYEMDFVNPAEALYDDPDFFPPFAERLPFNLDNRAHGEVLPIYLTEYGLKISRDRCRHLLAFNEFAINAVENRVNYIVGKGFQYKAAAADAGAAADSAAARAQAVIDDFVERNEWGELEQEAVRRCDRDGECFVRLFHVGDGRVEARFVEPEWVRSPTGYNADTSFGVETAPGDVRDVRGYWIVQDPNVVFTPAFTPAEEVVHVKLNVDSTAKRGVPTLLPVRKNLERADKLLRNMSTLAQIQATFALIRRHKQLPQSAVSAYQGNAQIAVGNPVTGQTQFKQPLVAGQIIDTSQNTEYEFPAARVDASGLVGVLQAELRAVASRLVMPEYMLTSDASNANYSSTLVAAAPAVKNFERLQALFARHFGDGRYGDGSRCGVLWRVLRYAVEYGSLPADVLQAVTIQVEGPSLTAVDKGQETTRAKTLADSGILSDETWAKWEGLDYRQERRQGAARPQPAQAPARAPEGGDAPDDAFAEAVGRILEACVPNKGGRGHHDDRTGRPCKGAGVGKRGKNRGKGKGDRKPAVKHAQVRRGVLGKIIGGAAGRLAGAKLAAKKVGEKAWNKLPAKARKGLARTYRAYQWVEHKLEFGYHAAQKMVAEVAKERGLPLEHVARVARIVATADLIARWTVNIPVVHHALDAGLGLGGVPGFLAAKVGYYMPVASLAYLGYSGVRNPLAMVRAARVVIAGLSHAREWLEAVGPQDAAARVLASMAKADDADWYAALLSAALDATHDLGRAAELADAAAAKQVGPPSDDGRPAGLLS